MGRPTLSLSLSIRDVCLLRPAHVVANAAGTWGNVNLRHTMSFASAPFLREGTLLYDMLGNSSTWNTTASALGWEGDSNYSPCLWLPSCMLELVRIGQWWQLVLQPFGSTAPARACGERLLFNMRWPSEVEAHRLQKRADEKASPPAVPMTTSLARFIAGQLRTHAPYIVQQQDEEDQASLQLELETAVDCMDMLISNFEQRPFDSHTAFSGMDLIMSLRAAIPSRSKHRLREVLDKFLDAVVPRPLHGYVRGLLNKAPSAADESGSHKRARRSGRRGSVSTSSSWSSSTGITRLRCHQRTRRNVIPYTTAVKKTMQIVNAIHGNSKSAVCNIVQCWL